MPTPWAFSRRMNENRSSISDSVSAAVGSSMMRMRVLLKDSALAISTICCLATVRVRTRVPARMSLRWSESSSALVCESCLDWFRSSPLVGSRPM